MDCSMPGLPVHHQFQESTPTHVHWVSDAILPSQPLLSPSPLIFNISQHQGLFKWVSSSHQVAKYWSFSFSICPSNEYSGLISFIFFFIFFVYCFHFNLFFVKWFLLEWTGSISLQSKELSRVFSNTTVQKHQFFGAQPSSESNSHIHTWLLEKPQLWLDGPFLAK